MSKETLVELKKSEVREIYSTCLPLALRRIEEGKKNGGEGRARQLVDRVQEKVSRVLRG